MSMSAMQSATTRSSARLIINPTSTNTAYHGARDAEMPDMSLRVGNDRQCTPADVACHLDTAQERFRQTG
jgi:hypothetical protein